MTVDSPATAGLEVIEGNFSITDDGSNGTDPNLVNNQVQISTPVEAAPDLAITLTVPEISYAKPGDALAFTLDYANTGNQDATGTFVDISLPYHTAFDVEASSAGWITVTEDSLYRYPIGDLSTIAQGELIFAVTVLNDSSPGLTEISLSGSIADDGNSGEDLNSANNQDDAAVVYSEAPDLSLDKTGPASVQPGMSLVYTLSYTNLGFSTATNLLITETLPEHTFFDASNSDAGWTHVGETTVHLQHHQPDTESNWEHGICGAYQRSIPEAF